jgi:sodium transport system permease protein
MSAAGMTLFLFVVLPLGLARLQGVAVQPGFQLKSASPWAFILAAILGCTLWPLAYDLIILCHDLGLATISAEQLTASQPALEALLSRWRSLPPAAILLALAIAPAIGEEFFFRGYLLGAFRGRLPAWAAIGLTAAIFGLFHASVFGLIALERVLASTLLGLALGYVCWITRSVFPGMILHAINNSLMLSLAYYGPQLQAWGWDAQNQRYLPLSLVATTTVVALVAIVLLSTLRNRNQTAKPLLPPSPPLSETLLPPPPLPSAPTETPPSPPATRAP